MKTRSFPASLHDLFSNRRSIALASVLSATSWCAAQNDLPVVGIPCYVNGDPADASASSVDAFVGVFYNPGQGASSLDTGTSTVQHLATAGQIGSTWGAAYDAAENSFYAATVLKRHIGHLSTQTSGTIYRISADTSAPSVTTLIDLHGMAKPTGGTINTGGTIASRDLGATGSPSLDPNAYALAGKWGLGDIDISRDGTKLYVINTFEPELITIDLTGASPTILSVVPINQSTTGVDPSNGALRPWAIGLKPDGSVYVGAVSTAENYAREALMPFPLYQGGGATPGFASYVSGKKAQVDTAQTTLNAHLLKLDSSGATFTAVLTHNLGYDRSDTSLGFLADWLPWSDTYPTTNIASNPGAFDGNPQPIFSDIEFIQGGGNDGDLLMVLMDRWGLQTGTQNSEPNPTGGIPNTIESGRPAGDVILFDNTGTDTWTVSIENGLSDDMSAGERAAALGGIAAFPSQNEFLGTCVDPDGPNSNGVTLMPFVAGTGGSSTRLDAQTLVDVDGQTGGNTLVFSKGLGLGDVEIGIVNPQSTVAVSGASSCNDNGTTGIGNDGDDYFTATVTFSYASKPATGSIELLANGVVITTSSVAAAGSTSQQFNFVELPANGEDVLVTARFTDSLGQSASTTVAGVDQCSVDFSQPVVVGNLVFLDENSDGIFTSGTDLPAVGVDVELRDADDNSVVDTATTDSSGSYTLASANGGEFYILVPASEFASGQPLHLRASSTGAGSGDDDANEDGINGSDPANDGVRTANFTLISGQAPDNTTETGFNGTADDSGITDGSVVTTADNAVDFTKDLGFVEVAAPVAVGNLVWLDANANGTFDTGEGVDGVLVELYRTNQTPGTGVIPFTTATTSGGGFYSLQGEAGDFFVRIAPSAFANGAPLAGAYSVPGNGQDSGRDDSGSTISDENGIDDFDPSTNGIRSVDLTLTAGSEPVETGQGATTDDALNGGDTNNDYTIDFGFYTPGGGGGGAETCYSPNESLPNNFGGSTQTLTFTVPDTADVTNVKLRVRADTENVTGAGGANFTHRDGINLTLTSPSGASSFLFDGPGGLQVNPARNNLNVEFDDSHNTSLSSDSTVHSLTGAFLERSPSTVLNSNLAGNAANGTWTLSYSLEPVFYAAEMEFAELCLTTSAAAEFTGIGNLVFIESGANAGYQAGEDTAVSGVIVQLRNDMGNVVGTAETDANGLYNFITTPGTYTVHIPAVNFQTGGALVNVTGSVTGNGANTTTDDNADEDGIDPSPNDLATLATSGISSSPVTLAATGQPTAGDTETGAANASDDSNDAAFNLTVDFGFLQAASSSTIDITNLTTSNYNASGTGDGSVDGTMDASVTIAYTGATAGEAFDIIIDGVTYDVTLPSGSTVPDGSTTFALSGVGIATSVEAQFDGSSVAAQMDTESATTPSVGIGNLVWHDLNNDGIYDDGTRTDEDGNLIPVESPIHLDMQVSDDPIQIQLFLDRDGDGVAEPTGDDAPSLATQTISQSNNVGFADSQYEFNGLVPGNYFVHLSDLPDLIPLSATSPTPGDDSVNNDDNGDQPGGPGNPVFSNVITLQPGTETSDAGVTGGNIDGTIDFALVDPSVGNLVWFDANANGVVDADERGIPGVFVQVFYDANGDGDINDTNVTTNPNFPNFDETKQLAGTTTNSEGFYAFTNLVEGNYLISIPPGNFNAGRALENFPFATTLNVSGSGIDTVDDDSNGEQPGGPGTIVRSELLNLTAGTEPVDPGSTNGTGPDSESGRFGDLDVPVDENGNFTYDFGFYGCEITLAGSQVVNLAIDSAGDITYDLDVQASIIGAPVTGTFTFEAGGQTVVAPVPGIETIPLSTFSVTGITVDEDGPFVATGAFSADSNCSATLNYFPPEAQACGPGNVGGVVFKDGNNDGRQEPDEAGYPFVAVRAYDCDNNLVGFAVSDKDGEFTVTDLGGVAPIVPTAFPLGLRLEFDVDDDGSITSSTAGSTLTQFVSRDGNCELAVAVANPGEHCQEDPFIVIPCYVNGDPLGGGDAGTADWLVRVPYATAGDGSGSTGNDSENVYLADGTVIGAVWGTAYDGQDDDIYTAAVVKRHSGLGQDGLGAIYRTQDVSGDAPFTSSLFIDLTAITTAVTTTNFDGTTTSTNGLNVGTLDRTGANALPSDMNDESRDADAFDKVGKVGLGDLSISEDGKFLYTINLFNKSLVVIPLDTPNQIEEYLIDARALKILNGEFRPWAVNFKDGEVFVGGVATGENDGSSNDLKAYVLRFTPQSPANFIKVLEFDLDYNRDVLSQDNNSSLNITSDWRPWIDEWNDINDPLPDQGPFGQTGYPQPILADIEFDSDGTIVLGIMDRFGMQGGNNNWSPNAGDTELYEAVAGGDTLKMYLTTSGFYQLETNGGAPAGAIGIHTGSSAGANNGEGPDGGEFFFEDRFTVGPALVHTETSLGGLAIQPGSGTLVSAVYDPVNGDFANVRSAGLRWFSLSNGARQASYMVFNRDAGSDNGSQDNSATFGKAAGLGEPTITCEPAGIEIGNFVFLDTDADGVQDHCDPALEGVDVNLYDSTGTLVASVQTNANGQYLFSSESGIDGDSQKFGITQLTPGTTDKTFYIVLGNTGTTPQFDGTQLTIAGAQYDPTTANSTDTGTGSNSETVDSDGIVGSPANLTNVLHTPVTIPAEGFGKHDHRYDFGFVPDRDFGDAPDSYLTTSAAGGANHVSAQNIRIGSTLDTEGDGSPVSDATGDGTDEDGVSFVSGTMLPTIAGTDNFCADVTVTLPTAFANSVIAADDFEDGAFSGGSGTPGWTDDWLEILGDGANFFIAPVTFGDGSNAGNMQETGGKLQIFNNDQQLCRQFDVPSDARNIVLTFDYESVGEFVGSLDLLLFRTNENEYVELAVVPQGNGTFTIDITDFVSQGATEELCFDTANMAGVETTEGFLIDNLSITADVPVNAVATASLVGWLDLNQNGSFEASEAQVISGGDLSSGATISGNFATVTKQICWSVDPADYGGTSPTTYARFRLSTDARLSEIRPGGTLNDGEVEDYALTLPTYDYGDLPEAPGTANSLDYPTSGNSSAERARHALGTGLSLGSTVDSENNGQPNAGATGDGADEDGFPFLPDLVPGETYTVPFTVSNTSATGTFYLNAWIDYDGNGTLGNDAAEQVATNSVVNTGDNTLTFTVPANATIGTAFARFRLSTSQNLTPAGDAPDGEVEDYLLRIVEELGAIGNYVWLDENSDGLQDVGEPGIANVKVDLKQAGVTISSTYTDADGGYLFPGLKPGDYTVDVDESTIPAGFEQTTAITNGTSDFGNKAHAGNGYAITLGQGEVNLTADFGYNANPTADVDGGTNTAALGDRVWIDADQDGVQDPGEIGVPGVGLTLAGAGADGEFGTSDDTNATTVTNAVGEYLFDGLTPGAYMVTVDATNFNSGQPLNGYSQFGDPDHFMAASSSATSGTAGDNKSTLPVVIGPGDVFLNVDFGYDETTDNSVLGSIGTTVWLDADASGGDQTTQGSEQGISGVTVALVRDADSDQTYDLGTDPVVGTATTNATGDYLFDGLPFGDYIVRVTDTNGVLTSYTQTYDQDGPLDATSATTISSGTPDDVDQDFSYTTAPRLGSIGDTVWADLDSSGGDQTTQGAEPGIVGITVTLTQAGSDGTFGTSDDVTIATTATDSNGQYLFGDLPLGEYKVAVDTADTDFPASLETTSSYEPSDLALGGTANDNMSIVIISAANPHDRAQDFSYPPAANSNVGSIGDTVYIDSSGIGTIGDGIQTAGTELGLANVEVKLLTDGDDNTFGTTDDVTVATTFTDVNGNYLFSNLPLSETYRVMVVQPSGYIYDSDTGDNQLGVGDGMSDVTLPDSSGSLAAKNPRNQDFSVERSDGNAVYSLGNTVWFDADGDGDRTEDPGNDGTAATREPAIPGVRVDLLDSTGTSIISTTTTNAAGQYLFNNLSPATYTVRVDTGTLPEGINSVSTYEDTDFAGDTIGDSSTRVTITNADVLDIDFSYPATGSLGNRVFFDGGTSGSQDAGDGGIPGIRVKLIQSGTTVAETTTDIGGYYLFDDLPFGSYTVMVDETTLPGNLENTFDVDSNTDGMSTVTINAATPSNLDQDFGYRAPSGATGTIGNFVFIDANANGTHDGEFGPDGVFGGDDDDEVAISSVTLDLFLDSNSNGEADPGEPRLSTTTTDAAGSYLFEGLPISAGGVSYVVKVTDTAGVLNGYWHTIGDQNVATNNTSKADEYPVTLTTGTPDVLTVDFGYYKELAGVGNLVWDDANDNGIQDSGETGVANAKLTLDVSWPNGDTAKVVTITDSDGFYQFQNLLADEDYNGDGAGSEPTYTIDVEIPAGYLPTTKSNVGSDDLVDSDSPGVTAEPVQGLTDVDQAKALDGGSEQTIASYDFATTRVSKAANYGAFMSDNAEALNIDDNTIFGQPASSPATNPFNGNPVTDVIDVNGDDMSALTGANSDADGDGFSNLLEYALCMKPDTGLKLFPDGQTANGGFEMVANGTDLDIRYAGPTGATDLRYTLQSSTDGQSWSDVSGITPTTAAGTIDGTTVTTYPAVNSLAPANATSPAGPQLFRLKVEALDTSNGNAVVAVDTPQVLGFNDHCIRPICETFADPFLSKCDVTASITSVSGQVLDLSGSLATGDDLTTILTGGTYYIEVVSGDNAGQRFDIASVSAQGVTLATDSDLCGSSAPYNTMTSVPANLAADQIVIRKHKTISEIFPVSAYQSGTTAANSARLLFLDRTSQNYTTYQLDSNGGSPQWETSAGASVMDRIVPPGEGLFTHNEGGPTLNSASPICVRQFGEVRTTKTNYPLCSNYNMVGAMHPVAQSPNGMAGSNPASHSRQMNDTNAEAMFTGSGARSRADQIQFWRDDTNPPGETAHLCYDASFYAIGGSINDWLSTVGSGLNSQDNDLLFQPNRSAIYCIQGGDRATNLIPSPINKSNGL